MRANTNRWNKIRYTLYLPVYDLIAGIFARQRKESIALLQARQQDKILVLGAGTGLDLAYLKGFENITAIDITPGMIEKLRHRAQKLDMQVDARVMDGHKLQFPDQTFDHVILHLILAVIPDPKQCIREVARVLKPGGTAVVFDKFQPDHRSPGLIRRFFNIFTSFLFSDITRKLGDIVSGTPMAKELEKKSTFGGLFKIVKLVKKQ